MLTTTRRPGESIWIETPGGRIQVKVSSVEGTKVRVSIEAPQSYKILRDEHYDGGRQ